MYYVKEKGSLELSLTGDREMLADMQITNSCCFKKWKCDI